MATINWTGNGTNTLFNNGANWSTGAAPGAGDAAVIAPAEATSIFIDADTAVGALTMASDVDFIIGESTSALSFTIGTSAGATTFSNAGTFGLDSFGPAAELIVGGPKLTLSGSGTLLLSDAASNIITGATAASILNNTGNLIEGSGQLGAGTLTFINGATGVVNADGLAGLVLNTGTATTTNSGLLEATGSGGLTIESTVNNGATGKITAAGGNVVAEGITIAGGTLSAATGYTIALANSTLDGTANAVTLDLNVAVTGSTNLSLLGTIANTGTIALLASGGYGTNLYVGPGAAAGTTTLTGSGTLTMSDESNNNVLAGFAGDTLVNLNNTISGAGNIGNGGALKLVNGGTIDATGINALVVSTTAGITNNKLIEATGRGGLVLTATVQNAKGTIQAAGSVVTLQNANIVGGQLLGSGGGYIADSGSLVLDGTKGVTNKTALEVQASSNLTLLGTVTNAGTILLAATRGYGTNLYAGPGAALGTVTLTGAGALTLSDESNNIIQAGFAGDTLVNLNNTISGAGVIGNGGSLTLINDATINANANNALVINPALAVINNKLIEATGRGGLVLTGTFENSAVGTIAAAGGVIVLNNTDIAGGTLTASGLGVFNDFGNLTLDSSADTITNDATVIVEASSNLTLLGTLTNAGTVSLAATRGYGTDLYVGPGTAAGTVTLAGSGALTLSDESNNYILANFAGATLVNLTNTISGAGNIGNGGSLTLINDATINATGNDALVIDSAVVVTNNALIEGTGAGGLVLQGIIANGAAGTISALGDTVNLSGVTIEGGLLNAVGGVFEETSAATIDGSVNTVTSNGALIADSSTNLTLLGTLSNTGTVLLQAADGYGATITVGPAGTAGTMTLTGAGAVVLTDARNNTIVAGVAGDTLVNLNNVISGGGTIGAGATLNIVNNATIDADDNHTLVIDAGILTNTSLIESTGRGGVLLEGTISNAAATVSAVTGAVGIEGTLENATGTISLAAGNLYLGGYPGQGAAAATIEGGTLNATGTGSVVVTGNGGTLDGTANTVTSNAKIIVEPSTNLTLLGTIANAGIIDLAANRGYGVNLFVGPGAAAGTATLTGAGALIMTDESNNIIQAGFAGDTLVNLNNTISGAGIIGNGGSLTLVNGGTIDATGINALVVNTSTGITNTKLIEATGHGGLLLEATVQNAGGTIQAAGSVVTLQNTDIVGGVLQGSGGGYILGASSLTLDATHGLTNKALVEVEASTNATLLGSLTNAGTILLAATGGYGTTLYVGPGAAPGTMTLTGSGALTLSDESNNIVVAGFAGDTLVNLNNTISGAGVIGNGGSLTLINDATINANGNNALVINPALAVINNKLIEATGRGGLVLTGTFENSAAGTIAAAGGVVTLSNTDITGGTLTASGLGVFYDSSNLTLDSTASAITNKATIIVEASSNLTLLGTLANAGTISLAATRGYGVDAYVGPGAAAGTMTLAGSGALTLSDESNNYILAGFAGDTLVNLNNTISGAGNIGNGGSLTLINDGTINANAVTNALVINTANPVTNAGLIEATGSGGLNLQSAIVNTGTISVSSGLNSGVLSFAGAVTNNGLIEASSGLAVISQAVSGTGTLAVGAGGTLSVQAGGSAGQTADFLATTGTLDLTNPLQFLGAIAGFGGSDQIDLTGTFEDGYSFANGTLTLTDNHVTVASLQFSGSYTQQDFQVLTGVHGGTVINFV